VIEAAEPGHSLSKLSPFALGKALQAQIGALKIIKRLQRGDILVETEKQSYSRMLLGLTQLAGVPVKVSPHRSLNTSRGVIRSRDIADCNVEEIVQELQPQGVTAASIIHVRDGDSRRCTNTVVLTFASPQPPKHITASYLRSLWSHTSRTLCVASTARSTAIARELARALLCMCTVGNLVMRQPTAKIKKVRQLQR